MSGKEIQEQINLLESDVTSLDNVLELAALYVIRDKLGSAVQNTVMKEMSDILPSYRKYATVKRAYQEHQAEEDAVLHQLDLLCQEIGEFLIALYGSSCFYKERRKLCKLLEKTLAQMQE